MRRHSSRAQPAIRSSGLVGRLRASSVIALSLAFAACTAPTIERPEGKVVIHAAEIPPREAEVLADRAETSRKKVSAWWGDTFDGPLRINVETRYRIPRSLVPAWLNNRGLIEFPARNPLDRALLHEIIHVYAPNGNRFLAEGLAVYGHAKLGGNPAYPNYGHDLDALAWASWRNADIVALDGVSTPAVIELPGGDMEGAYVVAGSFVGFLIDRYGMEQFRALYALTPLVPRDRNAGGTTQRYAQIYGKPLAELATEWRAFIAERTP